LNAAAGEKASSPSNYGLMDCMAALKWVQENVANFGGDPRRVTLVGHKAGAVVAHLLTSSPAVPPGKRRRIAN